MSVSERRVIQFTTGDWGLVSLRRIYTRVTGLLFVLYFGTESAVKRGGGHVKFSCEYDSETGVRPCPITFNTCMDWVLDDVDQSSCGTTIGNTSVIDYFCR